MTVEIVGPDLKPIPQTDKRGTELLVEILNRIEADDTAWFQGSWIATPHHHSNGARKPLSEAVRAYIAEHEVPPWDCGTAYCLAGHAVLACGAKLTPNEVTIVTEYGDLNAYFVIPAGAEDRQPMPIEKLAQELLNLSNSNVAALFHGSNTLEDLTLMVSALVDDPDVDLYHVTRHQEDIDWTDTEHYEDPYDCGDEDF